MKNASLIQQPDNYADENQYHERAEESSPQLFTACFNKLHGHARRQRRVARNWPLGYQIVFVFAIFCAMNNNNPRSLSCMRLNRRQKLARSRASLPELPHNLPLAALCFGRCGSLGTPSISKKS